MYLRLSGSDPPVQFVGTVTLQWIRKGCLKVAEGLEHFKAMLISKPADAKSSLCKWTASTPQKKKIQAQSRDDLTVLSALILLETDST